MGHERLEVAGLVKLFMPVWHLKGLGGNMSFFL